MQMNPDIQAAYPNPIHCDLQLICGPRFNTFGPVRDRREEPVKFFERSSWKAMLKRTADDETERWDGLE